jgi:zinc protease
MRFNSDFAFHVRRLPAITFMLASLISFEALANPHEYMLANGLKLIVREDHRSPVVVSQIWYKAGSIDELNGTTGVAHVLEHMMFKGTKNFSSGEFSKQIAAVGGRDNAFTGRDFTGYFSTITQIQVSVSYEAGS